MKKIVLGIVMSSILLASNNVYANCESVGKTIFLDALYGGGAGFIIGGLWKIAKDDGKNIASDLATGALIGMAIGGIVGIAEVGVNCRFNNGTSLNFKPIFLTSTTTASNLNLLQNVGFNVEYSFATK